MRTEQGRLVILEEMYARSVRVATGSDRAVSPVQFPSGRDKDDFHPKHIPVEADR